MDCAVINNSTLVDSIPLNDEENVFRVIDNDADISANSDDSINNYTLQSKNHDGWDAVKKKPHSGFDHRTSDGHSYGVKVVDNRTFADYRYDVMTFYYWKFLGNNYDAKSALGNNYINGRLLNGTKSHEVFHFKKHFSYNPFDRFINEISKNTDCPNVFSSNFHVNDCPNVFSSNFNVKKGHISYANLQKPIVGDDKGIWITNDVVIKQDSINLADSVNNLVQFDSKLNNEEFCCCKDNHCNDNPNTQLQNNQKVSVDVIADGNVNHDLTNFYNCSTQIKFSRIDLISLGLNKENPMNSKDQNSKSLLSLNQELDLINIGNNFKNFSSELDMGAKDLSINYSDCFFNCNGLEINLISDKLNDNDFNLEYYIFTNPDLIIDSLNAKDTPANNYLLFITTQNITPNANQNNSILNIESIFNQEFSFNDCSFNSYGNFLFNDCFFNSYGDFLFNVCSFNSYGDFLFNVCFFNSYGNFLFNVCFFNCFGDFLIENYSNFDNYEKLSALHCTFKNNTAFYKRMASLIGADDLKTISNNAAIIIGQNHLKLSNNDCNSNFR